MAWAPTPPIPLAVARIYEAKGRPHFNPLIAHVPGVAEAEQHARAAPARARARRGVLARTAHPGRAAPRGQQRRRVGLRRSRHHRAARAGAPDGARPARGVRRADRRAQRQPLRPRQRHDGRARRRRSRRRASISCSMAAPAPSDWNPPSSPSIATARVTLLRPGAVARAEIEAIIGPARRACAAGRSPRRACSRAITRRARACASTPTRPAPGEAYLAFGAARAAGRRLRSPRAAISSKRRPISTPPARARRHRRRDHRRRADPRAWPRRSDPRPPGARGGAAPLRLRRAGAIQPRRTRAILRMTADLYAKLAARLGPRASPPTPPHSRRISPNGAEASAANTPFLALPASTEEVADVVRLCAEAGAAITTQGGNTGLVGGQIPRWRGAAVDSSA